MRLTCGAEASRGVSSIVCVDNTECLARSVFALVGCGEAVSDRASFRWTLLPVFLVPHQQLLLLQETPHLLC
jgi:hypothetical protein